MKLNLNLRPISLFLLGLICPVALLSCSGNSDKPADNEEEIAKVKSYAEEYVQWINEPGISEMEHQRRLCHAYSRIHELCQAGDSSLAEVFSASLKEMSIQPAFAADSH